MFPFVLFGVVLYFGMRTVLEREASAEQPQKPSGPIAGPVDPGVALPIPETVSAPPGWPSNTSFTECEAMMSAMPKEQVRLIVQQVSTISDEEWAARKTKMISMGQAKLADCLEATRQFIKTMAPQYG